MKVKIIRAGTAEELEKAVNKWLKKEPKDVDRSICNTSYLDTTIGLLAIIEYCDKPAPFRISKYINMIKENEQ